MIKERTISLETLQSENYSDQSGLCRQNKKVIGKMFQYIRSFPLDEYEVELIHKDILGMTEEAERRGQLITAVIGNNYKEFCNELVSAVGGFEVIKNHKYIKAASTYYRIMGSILYWVSIFELANVLFSFFFKLVLGNDLEFGMHIIYLGSSGLPWFLLLVYYHLLGRVYKKAGSVAVEYIADASKQDQCYKYGIVLLVLWAADLIGYLLVCQIRQVSVGYVSDNIFLAMLMWCGLLVTLFCAILYNKGARNKK